MVDRVRRAGDDLITQAAQDALAILAVGVVWTWARRYRERFAHELHAIADELQPAPVGERDELPPATAHEVSAVLAAARRALRSGARDQQEGGPPNEA